MSETKGKSQKMIIIALIIAVIIIIIGGVIGYFAYKHIKANEPIEQEWANTYYEFIKEEKGSLEVEEDSEIGFIQIEEITDPVMVVKYEENDERNTSIYYINDGKISNKISFNSTNVELLYNVNEEKYDWYIYNENDKNDTYKKVSSYIEEVEDDAQYTYEKEETISVETVDGETISIAKLDTELIKTDVGMNTFDYTDDLSDEDLKDSISELAENYKTNDDILTEEIKQRVEEKVEEVNTKLAEIQEAEEAVEAKKAEEEKKAKGISAGSYTLKYGTYKGSRSHYADNSMGYVSVDITLELKTDGTYTISNTNSTDTSLYQNTTSSGTYSIETNYYDMSGYFLILSSDSWYQVTADNTLEVTVRWWRKTNIPR